MGNKLSFRQKAICMILIMVLVFALAVAAGSYRMYSHSMEEHCKTLSRNVAWMALSMVDGIELEHYIERTAEIYLQNPEPVFENEEEEADYWKQYDKVTDEGYGQFGDTLRKVRKASGAVSLCIIYVDVPSKTYIYVVDGGDTDHMCPIGTWVKIQGQDNSMLENPKRGLAAYITHTEEFGWVCRAGVPVMRADGTVAAFAVAQMPAGSMFRDRQGYLVKLCLIVVIIAAALVSLFWHIVKRMEEAAGEEVYGLCDAEEDMGSIGAEGRKEVS